MENVLQEKYVFDYCMSIQRSINDLLRLMLKISDGDTLSELSLQLIVLEQNLEIVKNLRCKINPKP